MICSHCTLSCESKNTLHDAWSLLIVLSLDAFDYEYDVARTVDDRVVFPTDQFDFIQKSYYNLLTYLMGMTKLLCETFTGQTFVQRSREELSLIWSQKRLGARTAWIQKQLARWSTVDEAVLLCRDWHALRSALGKLLFA